MFSHSSTALTKCLAIDPAIDPAIYPSGADITRSGTRTSAGGQVTGDTAKKALGEALEPVAARLAAGVGADPKAKAKASAKKRESASGNRNSGNSQNDETRKLQKVIKAFLNLHVCSLYMCAFIQVRIDFLLIYVSENNPMFSGNNDPKASRYGPEGS